MTLTITVLCVLCAVIGWAARVLWEKRPFFGERYEHPGCFPINNPWDPNDPITKAMMEDYKAAQYWEARHYGDRG